MLLNNPLHLNFDASNLTEIFFGGAVDVCLLWSHSTSNIFPNLHDKCVVIIVDVNVFGRNDK